MILPVNLKPLWKPNNSSLSSSAVLHNVLANKIIEERRERGVLQIRHVLAANQPTITRKHDRQENRLHRDGNGFASPLGSAIKLLALITVDELLLLPGGRLEIDLHFCTAQGESSR